MKKYVLYTLIICCFMPTVVHASEKEEVYFYPDLDCEHINEEVKDYLDKLIPIMHEDNAGEIQQRVNKLMKSADEIQEEINMVHLALCHEPIKEDTLLKGMFDLYSSFLTYVEKAGKENQNEQIESLAINFLANKFLYEIDAVFKESEESLHIEHYFLDAYPDSLQIEIDQNAREKKQIEEEKSGSLKAIFRGIADYSYQLFQNPIEKVLSITDQFEQERIDKQRKTYRDVFRKPAEPYKFNISFIEIDAGTKEQRVIADYYPSDNTFAVLQRLKDVHEVFPDVEYPREMIKEKEWNELTSELKRIDKEIEDNDVRQYVFYNMTPSKNMSDGAFLEQLRNR